MNEVAKRDQSLSATFREQVQKMNSEIRAVLPPHVPVERFIRVVLTAVNENPKLLEADRRSLLASCLRAAADGLLADGRDGALVIFSTKQGQGWIKKVQFMPMIGGLLRKARNSGEIKSIEAHVVYERDRFLYVLGDNPRLEHEPNLEVDDSGEARFAYAIAWLKSGAVIREVMTRRQLEQVRAASKAADSPDGPWMKWRDEMLRKSVFRRLYKWLPKSSELDDLVHREEGEEDQLSEQAAAKAVQVGMFKPVANPLADETPEREELPPPAAFSDEGAVDPETGEIEEIRQEASQIADERAGHEDSGTAESRASGPEKPGKRQVKAPVVETPESFLARAKESGTSHGKRGIPHVAMPSEFRTAPRDVADAWNHAYADADAERRLAKQTTKAPRGAEIDI